MPEIDDLDSGWEDEEDDVDAGWDDPEAEAEAKAGPPSRELTPEEREARAARAAARKERHRAKAAEKTERRKARAAAAAAKQKKSAPKVSVALSVARPARRASRPVEDENDDVERDTASEAPAREVAAVGARRNWRLILILTVLLVLAGGIAIALSRR